MTDRRSPKAFDVPSPDAVGPARPGMKTSDAPEEPARRTEMAPRAPRALDVEAAIMEADAFALDVAVEPPPVRRPRNLWLALAASCFLGLVGLGIGLWIERLVADLFAIGAWAGLLGATLAAGLVVATLAVVVKEVLALYRLGKRDDLRERAATALAGDDAERARAVALDLAAALSSRPETARGRAAVSESADAIMDAEDRLVHAEVALLEPLDREARTLVLAAARRVSVVTAVAPRALIDIAYVLIENARLVRAIATVYGLRPGRIGMLRLLRDVVGHLAVTGAVSAGDALIEQAVGHGVASRVSARLGEGILNGLLTTRMGLSAIDLCRPLPYRALARPTARDLLAELTGASRFR